MTAADLDLTTSARFVVDRLGVKDADELYSLDETAVEAGSTRRAYGVWREICLD